MRLLLAAAVFVLAGCAIRPPPAQPLIRPAQAEHAAFALNGRIAVSHEDSRSSSTMRWTHQPSNDEILLFAPLGQTVARIRRDMLGVALDTADKHYSARDVEELTEKVLGWHLPLNGLQYWVLALPAPGSEASIERDDNGQISTLRQNGWKIRYTRYAAQQPDSLPLRMKLQRDGMELQVLVDEWEIQ